MLSTAQIKAPFIVLLMASFIQGCGSATLIASSPAVPAVTIPSDFITNVQTVVTAIEMNQPEVFDSLIGQEGVAIGGFAQGLNFKGHNNSNEIVEAFAEALEQSVPVCEGYSPYIGALPDKAIVVYRGINFDWSRFGLSGNNSDGMTLQLFKLSEGWRLIYITPFNFQRDLPLLGTLQACPGAPSSVTSTRRNTSAPTPTVISLPTNTETTIPAETAPNQLDLSQMSVEEWASTSPDGKWLAAGLVAFPKENIGGQFAYVRLQIFSADGKTHWTIIDEWQDINLGFPIPKHLKWSQDGKHFYFTHQATPDGCIVFPYFTDLQRVNVESGRVEDLLPEPAAALAVSPDESQVAIAYSYFNGQPEMGLAVRNLATGEEQEIKIGPGKDFNAGNLLWSPDGQSFTLTLAINPCTGEYGLSKTVWAESTTILLVDTETLQQEVLVNEDPRLFITWEWNEPQQITITDGKKNSIWHLDVNTGEITRP